MSIWFEDMGRILFQVRVNLHHNDSEVFPLKRTPISKTSILLIYSLMEQCYWLMYACLSKTQITFPMKNHSLISPTGVTVSHSIAR